MPGGRLRFGAAVGVALTLLLVVVPARPAAAHGVGGLEPTNYESRVVGVKPELPGVTIRLLELGETVELHNESATEVVVLGYDEEPYLRVGPEGVFRNERSPATFWNRERTPSEPAPPEFDATAEPVWERIGGKPVARWHDHRAHWMGSEARGGGGRERVVSVWTLELVQGDRTSVVTGEIRWVPGPAPTPWLVVALVLAVAVVAGGRTHRWPPVLVAALLVLMGAEVVHVAGQWGATTEPVPTRLGAAVYSILGVAFGIYALARLLRPRSDPYDATPLALVAALVMTIAGGLADLPTLTRPFVPTTLTLALARSLVAVSLGVGVGTVAVAALRLRRPAPRRAAVPA